MIRASIKRSFIALSLILSTIGVSFAPFSAQAIASICPEANKMCGPNATVHTACICPVPGTPAFISGVCDAPQVCHGITYFATIGSAGVPIGEAPFGATGFLVSSASQVGGGILGISGLTTSNVLTYGMVGVLGLSAISTVSSLLGGKGGSSNVGGGSIGGNGTGCVTTYQTTIPTSDPCAIYNPNGGNTSLPTINLNIPTSTNPSLNNTNTCPVPPQCTSDQTLQTTSYDSNGCAIQTCQANSNINIDNNGSTILNQNPNLITNDTNGGTASDTTQNPPAEGLTGNIVQTQNGGTVEASNRNSSNNTEVAGFFGADGVFANVIGGVCRARPWANSIISYIIPPTFFDGLCSAAGFAAGQQTTNTGTQTTTQQTPPQSTTVIDSGNTQTYATSSQSAADQPPVAVIKVAPASVSIGQRATVYWSSQNVTACHESSSDGNFSGDTLSGGAYTLPISGPVTFTITCRALDGSPVSDSTTVGIGI